MHAGPTFSAPVCAAVLLHYLLSHPAMAMAAETGQGQGPHRPACARVTATISCSSTAFSDPAVADTIFRMASLSKALTVATLFRVAHHEQREEQRVAISDLVTKHVPELAGLFRDHGPPQLIHLATHRSGLVQEPPGDYTNDPAMGFCEPVAWRSVMAHLVRELVRHQGQGQGVHVFKPGRRVMYSNIGFALLGYALARATGTPFADLVSRSLLAPLGMDHSTFGRPRVDDATAQGRGRADVAWPTSGTQTMGKDGGNPALRMGYKVPNGGLWSTARDYATFVRACVFEPRECQSGDDEGGAGAFLAEHARVRMVTCVPPPRDVEAGGTAAVEAHDTEIEDNMGHPGWRAGAGLCAHPTAAGGLAGAWGDAHDDGYTLFILIAPQRRCATLTLCNGPFEASIGRVRGECQEAFQAALAVAPTHDTDAADGAGSHQDLPRPGVDY